MNLWRRLIFYFTIFISGLSVMGIELSASRLLAPFFGASLFVWTNIIGIILISLSIGYFFGGKFADKNPEIKKFYIFSLVAGFLIGLIPIIYSTILPFTTQAITANSYNDFLLSFVASLLLFAFPTAFLGAIVPYSIRIDTENIKKIGSKSGRIYAISTIGSIIGVYIPSILLIPTMGTRYTIVTFALLLIIISFIGLITSLKKNFFKKLFLSIIVISFLIANPFLTSNSISMNNAVIYEDESPYNYLQIRKINDCSYLLDKEYGGIWSKLCKDNYFTGSYWDYFLVSTSLIDDPKNVLILGLGAGTTARSFSAVYPNATIDGVEIDPLVVEIGKKYFQMDDSNLNTVISDGRLFVKTTENKYDVIIIDVYRDVYIPCHMVTVEFFKELESILNENGVISINLVAFKSTDFFNIFLNTISQVFSKVYYVQLGNSENYNVVATNLELTINEVKDLILNKREKLEFPSFALKDDALQLKLIFTEAYANLEEFSPTKDPILTDDKSPIEQIIGIHAFFPEKI
jgi:spermidine synthase